MTETDLKREIVDPTLLPLPSNFHIHLEGLQAAESPFWDAVSGCVWLVDMLAPALIRVDPQSDATRIWPMPETIGSFALCEGGGAIVALRSGVFLYDFETERLTLIARPEAARPENRLNDGKASPEGRFWVGSMSETSPRRPEGALYRIDHDGRCTRVLDGLFTSNGLAWSADGRRMFHSDSRGQIIRAFDYDPETGEISSGRVLARPSETEGRPDGGTVDSEGCYWSAGASAGCLNRFSPEGQLLERQILPIAAPSMLCFGGPALDQVFVTSLSRNTAKGSETGQLLSFSSKVVGLPGHRFRPSCSNGKPTV